MLQSIERYMKQAIVDKLPSVSSAALVSSLHLMKQGPEVVKRWVNEVQEAVNSDNVMVQVKINEKKKPNFFNLNLILVFVFIN